MVPSRTVFKGLVVFAALGGACGSNTTSTPTATIVLGAVIPETGSNSSPNYAKAIRRAAMDVNAALAARNAKFRFDFQDSDSTNVPAVAVTRTQELLAAGVKGLVTGGSGDTIAVAMLNYDPDTTKRMNVPLIGIAATSGAINNPQVTETDPIKQAAERDLDYWVFRTVQVNYLQAQLIINILKARGDKNGDGSVGVSIIAPNDVFGHGISDAAKTTLGTAGTATQVFYDGTANANSLSYGDMVTQLTTPVGQPVPDYVMDSAYPANAIGFMEAYRANTTLTIPVFHADTFRRPQVITGLQALANGEEGLSAPSADSTDSGRYFLKAMGDMQVTVNAFDSAVFDAATLLMLAAAKVAFASADPAAVTATQIRDALSQLSQTGGTRLGLGVTALTSGLAAMEQGQAVLYEGASGSCKFDVVGDVRTKQTRWVVENEIYVEKEVYDCAASTGANCPLLP